MNRLKTIVIILILLLVCSCKSNNIVGKWTYEKGGYTYTFNEDKTGDYNGVKFTYEIKDDKLLILYEGNSVPLELSYTIENDKLNLNNTFYIRK